MKEQIIKAMIKKEEESIIEKIIIKVLAKIMESFIKGLPIMLLWNYIVPTIFGLSSISYMQAVGLSLLIGLLFKHSV